MHIYKIKHKATGRVYIGQTTRKLSERFGTHKYRLRRGIHDNQFLQNVWTKYGEDSFTFTSICRATTIEELNRLEQVSILRYKASFRLGGFNLKLGGNNHKMAPETKEKLSLSLRGNTNGRANKGISKPNYQEGKPKKESTKQKISASLKGRKRDPEAVEKGVNKHLKSVVQLTLMGEKIAEYPSLKEAAIQTGANKSRISRCIGGYCPNAGGFMWCLNNSNRALLQQTT